MRHVRIGLCLSLTLALAAPGLARADEEAALIAEGISLRKRARDTEALAAFARAFALAKSPCARMHMALAEEALGRWVDAAAHLEEALAARQTPCVQRNLAMLEGRRPILAEHLGALEVQGGVAGAEVRLNDRVLGTLPMPRPAVVATGTGVLEVRAPGRPPVRRDVTIEARRLRREWIELAAGAPPLGAERATAPRGWMRKGAWVTGGGAAAALALAGVAAIVRQRAMADWNDDGRCLAGGRTRLEGCKGALDEANAAGSLTNASLVAAGIFAAATAGLLALEPRERRVACGGGPGALGLACVVRWK